MSLDRKDVRLKISVEAHRALSAIADLHEKELSEFASFLLERALLGEVHAATVMANRMARWGKSGQAGDLQGALGKIGATPLRRVKG